MEFAETIPIAVPTGSVNLSDWIFGLSDEDYKAVAAGHHAMGVIGGEERLGLINVEQIAGTLIVQHYYTEAADAQHVRFLSVASEGYLMRIIPFKMKVWWDMAISSTAGSGSELSCRIGFDAPAWVAAAGKLVRNDHHVHQHLIEETAGFARDIEQKYGATAGVG